MLLFFRKYTNLMTFQEEIYDFDISCEWLLQFLLSMDKLEVGHESTNDLIWHMYRNY